VREYISINKLRYKISLLEGSIVLTDAKGIEITMTPDVVLELAKFVISNERYFEDWYEWQEGEIRKKYGMELLWLDEEKKQ